MKQPLDLPSDDILAVVARDYGVRADSIEFLPLGEDSWCYRAGDYFVRVLRRSVAEEKLELITELAERLPLLPPLRTRAGALSTQLSGRQCIVQAWLRGTVLSEAKIRADELRDRRTEVGRAIAGLHATPITAGVERALPAEGFDRFQADLEALCCASEPEIAQQEPTLDSLRAELSRRGDALRSQAGERVIAHADIHESNVFVADAGELFVIDLDGLVLAPPERDLFFFEHAWPAYQRGYGSVEPRRALVEYYALEWAAQELADYGGQLLRHGAGEPERAHALERFRSLFSPGGDVERIEHVLNR